MKYPGVSDLTLNNAKKMTFFVMMHQCSPGELLSRAALVHHDDQGHDALRHHAILKGLKADTLLLVIFTDLILLLFHYHVTSFV